MNKRKKFLVFDTETANGLDYPLVYDFSGIVVDNYGEIYESFSLLNADIFNNYDLMNTAYYKEKCCEYIRKVKNNEYQLKNGYSCRQHILSILKKYNIDTILAYNADFDRRASNNTIDYETNGKYQYFFPKSIKFNCIMNMATHSIGKKIDFFKFCIGNNLLSKSKKYISTSAETFYRYLIKNPNENETHFGIEDCEIEYKIYLACLKEKKKLEREINRDCSQFPTFYHKKKGRKI